MPNARILIVEDNAIISRHIQAILMKNGYQICSIVPSGNEAIQKATDQKPELILMDIQLEGPMDGIEAAQTIQSTFSVPIIYLTAFADSTTLQRAKITDPFGYVLKPFDERTLITNIEMALNKHSLEKRLRDSEEQFRTLVENQGEGLGILDPQETFIFANPAMGVMMGVVHDNLIGRKLLEFITPDSVSIEQEANEKRRLAQKTTYEVNIYRPNGEQRSLSVTATPWFKDEVFSGTFSLCQDITERKRIESAEREQHTMAEALRDTAAALTSSLTLNVVLDRILSNVGRVVPHNGANIMLIDGKLLRIVRGSGELEATHKDDLDKEIPWQNLGFMRSIMARGEPIIIGNINKNGLEKVSRFMGWIRSSIVAPIRIKGLTVGALNLASAIPDFYSKAHIDRLQVFADQAGIAIENARLYEDSQKRARYLALLLQVTQAAINSSDLEVTLTEIARVITNLYNSDGAYITLWDESNHLTIPAAAYGYNSENYKKFPHNPGDLTMTESTLKAGKPIVAEDVATSEYINTNLAASFMLQSLLGIPLIAGDQKLGAILVGFLEQHKFTPEDIEQGQEIASQVALAITKLRLYAEIQRLAIIDELTGLYNRRGIFDLGRQQVELSHRTGAPLSMVWLDIDQFKNINDRFGHHIGDQVIAVVAERCRNNLKSRDLVGRYGGEGGDELIILLLDTPIDEAQVVAERLRTIIMKSSIATYEGKIDITVSQGITTLRGENEDFQELLTRADKAMFAAKAAGRNCIFTQA